MLSCERSRKKRRGGAGGSFARDTYLREAEGDTLGALELEALVEEAGEVHVHAVPGGGVQQDVLPVAVPEPHNVPHHGPHRRRVRERSPRPHLPRPRIRDYKLVRDCLSYKGL